MRDLPQQMAMQQLKGSGGAMSFHPNNNLPDCMMPDGGDCCVGHAAVVEDWLKQRRRIEALEFEVEHERHNVEKTAQEAAKRIKALEAERDDALAKGAALFWMIPDDVAAAINMGDVQNKWRELLGHADRIEVLEAALKEAGEMWVRKDNRIEQLETALLEIDRALIARRHIDQSSTPKVLLPCPVCGGEAIHAIDTLKRTVIQSPPKAST